MEKEANDYLERLRRQQEEIAGKYEANLPKGIVKKHQKYEEDHHSNLGDISSLN